MPEKGKRLKTAEKTVAFRKTPHISKRPCKCFVYMHFQYFDSADSDLFRSGQNDLWKFFKWYNNSKNMKMKRLC